MPTLTILPQNKTVSVEAGVTLLNAILGAGISLAHRCGGGSSCGSCHLFVQEGRKSVSKLTPGENSLLDSIVGVGSKSRLACQTKLGTEDVTVELLGFKSGL
jgi:2Fe-2S ferredoxin